MKKKLLSLVLAAMMTVGCFAGLGAAVGQDTDFAALSVEDQYAAIMAAGSEADAQALFDTLDAEQQAALTAYADRQQENTDTSKETDPIPAVNYTNVAPLVTVNKVSQPAKARLMSARSTASPIEKGKTVDGLVMNKTATPVEGSADDYKITLEAYTTGTVSTSETTKPTDIVLVLDQSGSMDDDMTTYKYTAVYPGNNHNGKYYVKYRDSYITVTWCSECNAWTDGCSHAWWIFDNPGTKYTPKTSASDTASGHVQFYSRGGATTVKRLDALKKAVKNFAADVAEKAKGPDGKLGTEDDVAHRIAVVGFASGGWYGWSNYKYNNTEVFVGEKQYTYGTNAQSVYSSALQDMSTQEGQNNITASIGALDAKGGTLTNLGMEMANGILAANSVTDNSRKRIVVVFTDGEPGWEGYDSDVADDAIKKANTTKNTHGATVYTVGIFDNADATSAGDQNGTDAQKSNWFMQKLSSNNGTPQDPSYYLSASDAETLNTIFQKISGQISESKLDLGSQTVVKDTVTKYFNMPNVSDVTVKTADCTGVDANGQPTWSTDEKVLSDANVTIDGNAVNVTGFDFNANYITDKGRDENDPNKEGDFYGRKLIIEFTVTTKDGFVGGNSVPTNGSDSGVYDKDDKEVATFDVPQVNVPIKSELTVNNKVIYEGGSADVSGLYNAADTSSWMYDFVNVSYEVKNGDTAVTGSVSPADCTDYTVKATFSPKYDGKNADGKINDDVTDGATATVHVLKPTVTVNATDVSKYYGESYNTPEGSNITGSVTWADERGHDISGITVIGSEPYGTDDLQYSYDHGKFVVPNTDTTIKVSAKVGGVEKACTSYVVHPKFCTLTVNKSVAKTYSNNDSFIFNVVGKGNVPYNAQVVITGNGRATLTGLPVGNYTVTEDTAWSWRYTCDNSSASTTLSASKDNDSLTITNKLTENNWLGNETFVINKCESKTIEKVSFIQQAIDFLLGR